MAILIYDQVEVLDFAGPFEVFAVAGELHDEQYFEVALVAAEDRPFTAVNGLKVLPNRIFATIDDPDVLVIPGGQGSRNAMQNDALLAWVRQASRVPGGWESAGAWWHRLFAMPWHGDAVLFSGRRPSSMPPRFDSTTGLAPPGRIRFGSTLPRKPWSA